MEEKRINRQLEDYWDSLRGTRAYPEESEVNADALTELWPHILLIEMKATLLEKGFFYTHMGRSLIEAYGADYSGREVVEQLLSNKADHMVQDVLKVRDSGQPVIRESEFDNAKGVHVKFRRALFPLGDAERITHIIGGMRWKLA